MKSMLKFAMFAAAVALMILGFGVNANATITYSFDSNLVLYYSFDDGTTATDDSTNSNDGTISGATHDCSDTPSTTGNSCSLDLSGGPVDAGNDMTLQVSDGDFTISVWLKFETGDLNGDRTLVNKMDSGNTDGWFLLKQDDTKFWFCFGGGSGVNGCTPTAPTTVKSTTSASLGAWTNVIGVKDGDNISIYVNGVFEGISDMSGGFLDTNFQSMLIGAFGGLIDEVRLYEVALTAGQIAVLAGEAEDVVAVPEPSTMSIFLLGLAGLVLVGRRRRRIAAG